MKWRGNQQTHNHLRTLTTVTVIGHQEQYVADKKQPVKIPMLSEQNPTMQKFTY